MLEKTTNYLSQKIGSEVSIKTVEYNLFTEFQFSDIHVKDLSGKDLLAIDDFYLRFRILPLFQNKLIVKTVILSNPTFNVLADSLGNTNFSHIIEAFKKDDDNENASNFYFQVRTFLIKNGDISFTNIDTFKKATGFDPNHIHIANFNASIYIEKNKNDSIEFNLKNCSFNEQSGLIVKQLQAESSIGKDYFHVDRLYIQLPSSVLEFDYLSLDYAHQEKITSVMQLLDKSSIAFITKKVSIKGEDIACFVPELKFLEHPIEIFANAQGAFNGLQIQQFNLRYGQAVQLAASVELTGINNLDEMFIYTNINEFSVKLFPLESLIASITRKPFLFPTEIRNLGQLEYSGNISGFFSDIVAYGKLQTNVGTLSTDILLAFDIKNNTLDYKGNLRSSRLRLNRLLGNDSGFGNTQFRIDVNGKKNNKNELSGTIKGIVQSLDYNRYTYKNIKMDGSYNPNGYIGQIDIDDENGKIHFDGDIDISRNLPIMNFVAEVENLKPYRLNLTENNKDLSASFSIKTSIQGSSIDNIVGNINIQNVELKNNADLFTSKSIEITSNKNGQKQQLTIESSIINASLEGEFTLSTLGDNFLSIIHEQFSDIDEIKKVKTKNGNNFTLQATIEPLANLAKVLEWKISTEKETLLYGFYNDYEDQFALNIKSSDIKLDKSHIYFAHINIENPDKHIETSIAAGLRLPKDSIVVGVSATSMDKHTDATISWENHYGPEFNGIIHTRIVLENNKQINRLATNINILPSDIVVHDSIWHIAESDIFYTKDSLVINQFSLEKDNKYVKINGTASKYLEDILHININQFNLEYLSNLIELKGIHLSGVATGVVSIQELFKKPIFNANINAKDFGLNSAPFGDVKALATYNYDLEQIDIEGVITNKKLMQSEVKGHISPTRNDMLLRADMREVNLKFLDPYLSSFAKDIEGEATGVIYIGGDLRAVEVWGKAFVNKAKLHIDFLKTDVYFSDYITMHKNAILLTDITIADKKGNKGKLNGKITHNAFSDFVFDIDMILNNMLVYNTTDKDNPDFFGTVYASGVAKIYGNVDLISIDVAGKTEKNTIFYIPINTSSSAIDGNFITFINRNQVTTGTRPNRRTQQQESTESQLRITVQVEATPDAEVVLILDERTREYIQGNGNGNIRLSLEPNENLKMYGNYTLNEGKYYFVMQNAIRITFDIRDGSTIAWDGNPYNGAIDILATYQVSASLLDLFDANMLQDVKRLTIPVLCKVHLTGELQQPNIKLDLELPTADDELRRRVQNIVHSEEMMSNQMVFLLMLGRFYNPQLLTNSQPSTAGMATMIASATLSSQLNYWLSQISNDVNLGVNYRQTEGADITSREIEVALTTNLLDNRLIINSNVGYREDAFTENNFIGDFDIEYKINRSGRLRLKAYSHSNDKYYVRNALTTQGVGIVYREDFDSTKNIFNSIRRIFRKKSAPTQQNTPIEQTQETTE